MRKHCFYPPQRMGSGLPLGCVKPLTLVYFGSTHYISETLLSMEERKDIIKCIVNCEYDK